MSSEYRFEEIPSVHELFKHVNDTIYDNIHTINTSSAPGANYLKLTSSLEHYLITGDIGSIYLNRVPANTHTPSTDYMVIRYNSETNGFIISSFSTPGGANGSDTIKEVVANHQPIKTLEGAINYFSTFSGFPIMANGGSKIKLRVALQRQRYENDSPDYES
jgi:hypothetical protein